MISICLAMYNGSKYIREQLDSILSQSCTDWNLIVSDDGSTDGSQDIVKEYASRDSRILLIENDGVHGFKGNFSNAVNHATGEYVAFCDQDDIWTQDHLEVLLDGIQGYDVCSGNAHLVDAQGNDMGRCMLSDRSYALFDPKTIFYHLTFNNIFQGTAMMCRTQFVRECMPLPDCVRFHDYWLALNASINDRANYVNKVVLEYRQHGDNQTQNDNMTFIKYVKRALFANNSVTGRNDNGVRTLALVRDKITDPDKKAFMDKAIRYGTNWYTGHQRRNALFYIKNYRIINLEPKDRMFVFRVIKKFVLGI